MRAATKAALGGAAALAAGMGVGRFAYTPLLPLMVEGGAVSLAQASWLATANYAGYLVGALAAAAIPRPILSARAGLWSGLAVVVATTALVGIASGIAAWAVLRLAAGVGSAFVMVYASALVTERAGAAPGSTAIHFAGVGAGIALSSVLALGTPEDWRAAWLAQAALAAVLAAATGLALRASPAGDAVRNEVRQSAQATGGLTLVVIAYGLAGFGYIVTATFLPAIARAQLGATPVSAAAWIAFGLAAMPSTVLWARLGARFGDGAALIAAFALQALGVVLPALAHGPAALAASGLLVGGTFVGIVTLAYRLALAASPTAAARAFAVMTAAYGVGQIVGPPVAGAFAGDGFAAPLAIAAGALVTGMLLLAWMLRLTARLQSAHAPRSPRPA